MYKKNWLCLLVIMLSFTSVGIADTFLVNKDYEVIANADKTAMQVADGKVKVQEFFSFACPACNKLEPALEKWLASKPKNVEFERIPVAFNNQWELLAKAYYTAEALNLSDKVTPALFKAIHEQNMHFEDKQSLAKFFSSFGVSAKDFDSAFSFSPGIDAQLNQGRDLLQKYAIIRVPTLVICGKYQTTPALTMGDTQKTMQVVTYLIAQCAKESLPKS